MDCSLSGSSVHEIFQARVLEWVAIAETLVGTRSDAGYCFTDEEEDITLPTKIRLVKAVVFPVVMYGCELRVGL